jgi:hypothetical protein
MCRSCAPPLDQGPDLFDLWREAGLLSEAQHTDLREVVIRAQF